MSNEVKACNCVHTDDKVWDIEFNINISNEENSCCTYFVVEYSNASDYVLIERNKVNNIVIANYLPAVLNFEFDSKVNKQQTVSYQSLLSVKIPIVNSSLLI